MKVMGSTGAVIGRNPDFCNGQEFPGIRRLTLPLVGVRLWPYFGEGSRKRKAGEASEAAAMVARVSDPAASDCRIAGLAERPGLTVARAKGGGPLFWEGGPNRQFPP